MNLLALDTGTDTLSVAVQKGTELWEYTGMGGAKASTSLLPIILSLLEGARLTLTDLAAIAFGAGPGTFTGLRTACSVAQGLAFAADVPVLTVDSLLAVAETARWQRKVRSAFSVTALIDARMDEIYMASYFFDSYSWHQTCPHRLAKPENVQQPADCWAGNVFEIYGDRLPTSTLREVALPSATAMLRLAPALMGHGQLKAASLAWPTYVRDKVAQTTVERLARPL